MTLDAQLAAEQFKPDCRRCPTCRLVAYFWDAYRPWDPARRHSCYTCRIQGESAKLKHTVTIGSGTTPPPGFGRAG
jgi:hypothetical protein